MRDLFVRLNAQFIARSSFEKIYSARWEVSASASLVRRWPSLWLCAFENGSIIHSGIGIRLSDVIYHVP